MMEEFYYRCKQLLEEILTTQGFTEQAEKIALGSSIGFTKDDIEIIWLYDLRDRMLFLGMTKSKKYIEKGYFYSVEQLKSGFLPKLEEMLDAQGLAIPEKNRRLAIEDLGSFHPPKAKKGFFARLFGKK